MARGSLLAALGVVLAVSFAARTTTSAADAAWSHATQTASPPPQATAPPFNKQWKMEDLRPAVADLGTGRDWAKGREVFQKAACGGCHSFGTEWEGSGLAPDLTGVASKLTRDAILQAILEPSATLNGQYFHTTFTLKDGTTVTGSVIDVVNKKIIVAPVMLAPQATVEVPEANVKSEEPSNVSPMPPGLLDPFTREQIIELMAYLDSGGDKNAAIYRKK
jgi:putative heme-binding domain-containing protein